MGTLLEQSGIANRLFDAIHIWTKKLPGGLAIGTIIMCTICASSGIIGATETVVGLLALPIMMAVQVIKVISVPYAGGSWNYHSSINCCCYTWPGS